MLPRDAAHADTQTLGTWDEEPSASLVDQLRAARRRAKPMAVAFGAILLAAVLAALLWPPTYRSTGTILIEQQEIPADFVRSAVSSYADQRVQVISQRVMTSANLLGLIDKFKLYASDRDSTPRELLVERMREDIRLEMISADVVDPRLGRATQATIAFSVSYDNRSPVLAARVANELTSLYLRENLESRKQLAADTAGFLAEESERLRKRVAEIEQQIADFKTLHGDSLPEMSQLNLQLVNRTEDDIRELSSRIRSLDQQIVYLDAQLTQISPTGIEYTDTGLRVLSPNDRLKMARTEYASKASNYSATHPDIVRLKREIESLERQVAGSDATQDLARQLTAEKTALASARQNYTDDHPDVKRLERSVASLEAEIERGAGAPAPRRAYEVPDNPAYIQIKAQREASANERAALLAQQAELRARSRDLESRIAKSPEVEREYNALQRDLLSEQAKYAEVRQKLLEAQLAENLEAERKSERFSLIEPPIEARLPVRPNRPAILLLGLLLAVAAAVGVMLLLEATDRRIRDRNHVVRLLNVPPLAVIPRVRDPLAPTPWPERAWQAIMGSAARVRARA